MCTLGKVRACTPIRRSCLKDSLTLSDWNGRNMHTSSRLVVVLLFTKGVNCYVATGLKPVLLETILGKKTNLLSMQPIVKGKSNVKSMRYVPVKLLPLLLICISLVIFICPDMSQCLCRWGWILAMENKRMLICALAV